MNSTCTGLRGLGSRFSMLLVALGLALVLAGCGDRKSGASQVAAKVNKEEISVHQINFVLERQQGIKPEQADAVSRQILERLIEQEIAVQKAEDLELDRDPRVVRQLEASRREILSRAYLDRAAEAASKATPEEVKNFYDEKPALFKERRVYSIQELAIEATPDQVDGLRTQLQTAKTLSEFVDHLKASGIRFNGNQAVRAAEQLPLNMLDAFAKMKDGQTLMVPTPGGVQVVALVGSRDAPIDEATARPAIEQYLLNDRKRKVLEENMKSLRAAAEIEYVGKFAEAAASGPVAAGGSAPSTGAPASNPSTPTK